MIPERSDEAAVVDLLYDYCHTLDAGNAEGCADCFTVHGVWQAQWVDGTAVAGHRFVGRDQLVGYFRRVASEHPPWSQLHLVHDPRVVVHGDTASVQSYFTTAQAGKVVPVLGAMGRYLDEAVRDRDGRWRLSVRTVVVRGA